MNAMLATRSREHRLLAVLKKARLKKQPRPGALGVVRNADLPRIRQGLRHVVDVLYHDIGDLGRADPRFYLVDEILPPFRVRLAVTIAPPRNCLVAEILHANSSFQSAIFRKREFSGAASR